MASKFLLGGIPVLVLSCSLALSADQDPLRYARENPVLRDYFAKVTLEANLMPGRNGSYRLVGDPSIMKKQTDGLIDIFLKNLVSKMVLLKSTLRTCQEDRREFLASASREGTQAELELRWLKSLRDLSDRAADVHRLMSYPLTKLAGKDTYRPHIQPEDQRGGFKVEMDFMADQTRNAEQGIVDFLFRPTHTVSVAQLQSGGMLSNLMRIRTMALELSKVVESEVRNDQARRAASSGE
jgi:hypothetical protein